jgi:hypothetical protein
MPQLIALRSTVTVEGQRKNYCPLSEQVHAERKEIIFKYKCREATVSFPLTALLNGLN